MRYLCIDTSAGASCALVDSATWTVEAAGSFSDPRSHAERLSELVADVVARAGHPSLAHAGIDRVVVGTGPAPFTGLRAGLVAARTIAHVLGTNAVGVPSIAALARCALDLLQREARVVVATDARRKEVYAACYEARGAHDVASVWGPEVARPDEIARRIEPGTQVTGAGAHLYGDILAPTMAGPLEVTAGALARIAHTRIAAGASPADLDTRPLYLRGADIHGVAS